jgi:hypothetical protein
VDVADKSVEIITNNAAILSEVSVNPLTQTYVSTCIQKVVNCNAVNVSIGVRSSGLVLNNTLRSCRVDVQLRDVAGLNVGNLEKHNRNRNVNVVVMTTEKES